MPSKSALRELKERGQTVNSEQCTFRMTKVVFMGLLLTRHVTGPTKEKVRAVVETSQQQSPSEARSFLGLVEFSLRFIPDFQPLLILSGRLQDKRNHLSGFKSKRSHFRS